MISAIKSFTATQQSKLFCILCLSTAFCFALVAFRIHYADVELASIGSPRAVVASRGTTFLFLIWNLFLAWIPYWIAISIKGFYKLSNSKILAWTLIGAWLVFFPNAPYIITDLLHLRNRYNIPHWYDLMLIVSFAWTGLMLGLISLHEVRIFIKELYSESLSWFITLGSTILCGFGIYLGRCLRFNTWDILTNPIELTHDILISMTDSMALKITLVFSIFLLLGYLTLNTLINSKQDS